MRRTRPKEPSRPFQPVSLQSFSSHPSPPERVPGRNGTTSGETTTENDVQCLDFDFFRSDFATVPYAPLLRTRIPWGCFERYPTSTVGTAAASGQPVRFFCLVRTTTATCLPPLLVFPSFCAHVTIIPLPSPIPSNDDRSTNHSRTSYAFVEFRSTRDAEDAYNDMYVLDSQPSFLLNNLS